MDILNNMKIEIKQDNKKWRELTDKEFRIVETDNCKMVELISNHKDSAEIRLKS